MPIETDCLTDDCTLWASTGYDDNGNQTVASPVDIKVRWVVDDTQFLDSNGRMVSSSAKAIVDRDIAEGSILRLGKVHQLPATPTALFEVKSFRTAKDVKGRDVRRTAMLFTHNKTLPATT